MLSQTKSTELEVPKLKKLRIMLRNEAASYVSVILRSDIRLTSYLLDGRKAF
jgi:hypothetical protein